MARVLSIELSINLEMSMSELGSDEILKVGVAAIYIL
jgi:hypothetical protein